MRHNTIIVIISIVGIGAVIFLALFHDGKNGRGIFMREGCNTCHMLRGEGGGAGPDLTDVMKRRGRWWIRNQIRDPRSHDPASRMPSYSHLSFEEIRSLISYLASG